MIRHVIAVVVAALGAAVPFLRAADGPLVLELRDYASAPITGSPTGQGNAGPLARINVLREEPGGAARLFVADLNGPIYIVDKQTRRFTTYLDLNGTEGRPGLFPRFAFTNGLANGVNSLTFDPDYRRNGRFYTVHIENAGSDAEKTPIAGRAAGFDTSRYTPTPSVPAPGEITRQGVLIEWTDRNIANATFEGTAREILRVDLNLFMHPLGEIVFNPAARPNDPDWRVLYVAVGDGGAGEQHDERRASPQRLDTLVGKILRIVPDVTTHVGTSLLSSNGQYRIPRDNPFVGTPGAKPEIWAYGLRNPHRLSWAIDATNPANNRLVACNVGLHTWESVYLIRKGANYGYPAREGNEALGDDNRTMARPADDRIPVLVSNTITTSEVTPSYPVIQYPHRDGGGDAVGGGFLYRGRRLPALRDKFVFIDITTGRIWYADYREMLAADDALPHTLAAFHALQVRSLSASRSETHPTMTPIVLQAYLARGGQDRNLPGAASVAGAGRADVRLAVDDAGELYVFSKSDGVIREVVAARPN
jgi:hypothetical protein